MSERPPPPLNTQAHAFFEHLESEREAERSSLARIMHDDLGGSLVSAMMDLGNVQRLLGSQINNPEMSVHVGRVQDSLRAAIQLKRQLIEKLRPSMLDNLGLFAACRWYLRDACDEAGIRFTQSYPPDELPLTSGAKTALFRSIQGVIGAILSEPAVRSVELSVQVEDDRLVAQLSHETLQEGALRTCALSSFELQAVRERLLSVGAALNTKQLQHGMRWRLLFPLASLLLHPMVVDSDA